MELVGASTGTYLSLDAGSACAPTSDNPDAARGWIDASNSGSHPSDVANSVTAASQSPRCNASRWPVNSVKSNAPGDSSPSASRIGSGPPTTSRLMSNRGTLEATLPVRDANGCTLRDVPITISKSQAGKSSSTSRKKRSGNCSPKKTISGLTNPPCFSASQRQPPSPSAPTWTARCISATATAWPVSIHVQPSKLPWAATITSFGIPATVSRESIF
mmetsp:Transcript_6401/g.14229  ORF Transcript_6401/g.14229 Transcript_6401/m.14229 type:complete len:217 (+) Transcript_6401:619-1269(+)